jgi:hypothetical protein
MTFSHAAHLAEKGVLSPTGRRQMVCADCHTPDSAGRRFLPITYRTQCHSCHNLKFDVDLPWGEVPHDDVAAVRIAIEDFYGRQALQGAIPDPAAAETERRRPGAAVTPSEPERRDALAWAAAKTRDALAIVFDEKRGCAYCHLVDKSAGTYALAPVLMRTRFLPHADFDHASHRALACTDCHDSRRSDKSSDVLIPGIEVCTTCHGKQKAALKTPSTCTSCHGFHDSEFGRMPRTTAERR